MRKIFLLMMVAIAAIQMNAANVDQTTAQHKAAAFMQGLYQSGRLMAPRANLTLLHAEKSDVKVANPVYYIFAAGNNFVIVAGEDRAEEILAYGDNPFDINNMPCNMQAWLNMYKKQIEYLQEHPGLVVEKTSSNTSLRAAAVVAPLLTATWDQTSPYWNQCPTYGYSRCYTGCPATSLAQVFYYWKYPTAATPAVPSYRYKRDGYTSYTTVAALPSTTFDWMNMKDSYRSYNNNQANAVATLMRYVGQAEHMKYDTNGSGIAGDSVILITNACKFYGYQSSVRNITKWSYTNNNWINILKGELDAGRPVVYCAQDDNGGGGHAFNVDGYDSDGKFHINWGWSGSGNAYYAMNAFNDTYGTGNFNTYQQMVIGIEPPYQGPTPVLTAEPDSLSFVSEPGDTVSQTFILKGVNLRQGVTLSLSSSAVYSISQTTFTAEEVTAGVPVTVKFSPKNLITYTATITASSLSAQDIIINLTGVGKRIPVLTVNPTSLEFTAMVDERVTQGFLVKGANLTDNVTVKVVDDTEDFYVDKAVILKSGAITGDGVTVYATYYPADYGTHNARVIISGGGAEPVTVNLTGHASVPKETPVMQPASAAYITLTSFKAEWTDASPDYSVDSYTLWLRPAGGSAVTYTGIGPDKFYTFENLAEGGTYYYKVKTVFVDGTESDWSNTEEVTLYDNAHPYNIGDVNHDGVLTIADVIKVIDYILDSNTTICPVCADVNADGVVTIADVSRLIDMILGS